MKRLLLCTTLLVGSILFFTGCGHEHEWLEATCTAPKTCNTCGEIEGEPLGHDMAEATCTTPEKCQRCGFIVGAALGHDWIPANFQDPATCSRCGETDGEPLHAEFLERMPDAQFMTLGETYDYQTICYDNTSSLTTGKLTVTEYNTFASDDSHPGVDGYEWKVVKYKISFSDTNSYFYGASVGKSSEDFYNTIDHDASAYKGDDGNTHFTVTFGGEDYDKCLSYPESTEWVTTLSNKTITQYGAMHYLLPVGYDGQLVCWYSREHSWEDGMTIFDVATDTALFFRLD